MSRVLFIAVLLFVLAVPLAAQDAEDYTPPLIFFGRGLYIVDEKTLEVTEWGGCGDGMGWEQSHNGEWLGRLTTGVDIRLCNVRTREVIDVAATLLPEQTVRMPSYPAWPPDDS